ncbi:MAG: S-layer homology domain-containing protein [Oscillospiraceae bacterium]|nr:S-layer homology domain-containing protein [Oscillospiraceae bacterium]
MKKTTRVLSVILSLVLIVSLFPAAVFADGEQYRIYQYNSGAMGELSIGGISDGYEWYFSAGDEITANIAYGEHENFYSAVVRLSGVREGTLEVSDKLYNYNFINISMTADITVKFYADEEFTKYLACLTFETDPEDGMSWTEVSYEVDDCDLSDYIWELKEIDGGDYKFVAHDSGIAYSVDDTTDPKNIAVTFTMPESDVEIKWRSYQDEISYVNDDIANITVEIDSGYEYLSNNQFFANDEVEVKLHYSRNTTYKDVGVQKAGKPCYYLEPESGICYTADSIKDYLFSSDEPPVVELYTSEGKKAVSYVYDGSSIETRAEQGFDDFDEYEYLWSCYEGDEENGVFKLTPHSREINYTVDDSHFADEQYLIVKFTMPDMDVVVHADAEDVYTDVSTWAELQQAINDNVNPRLIADITASDEETALTASDGTSITIDLNGHKIDRNLKTAEEDGSVFKLVGNGNNGITILLIDNSEEKGGVITGANNIGDGGAIYAEGYVYLTLADVAVENNKATGMGGAVYTKSTQGEFQTYTPHLDLWDAVITGNEAKSIGGVYLCKEMEAYDILLSGDTVIRKNKNGNLYLSTGVQLGDVLFEENFSVGITMQIPGAFAGTVFFDEGNIVDQARAMFYSDDGDYYVGVVNGKINLIKYYVPEPEPAEPAPVTVTPTDDESGVNVTVEVSGGTATVAGSEAEKVLEAEETGTVTIDVSALGDNVSEIVVPGDMIGKIAEAVASEDNTAEGLEIKLPGGSVSFDKDAVAAIASESAGKNLKLNLEKVEVESLNEQQQNAIADMEVGVILDAKITSDDKPVSSFEGGKAKVSVPFELKEGQIASGVAVYYVADDGSLTRMNTRYSGGKVEFTTSHFSNYVIVYDPELVATCPKDDSCPVSDYSDVDADAWYHDGVHFVIANGFMIGYGDGSFGIDDSLTRAAAAQILWNMEGRPASEYEMKFTDVDKDAWYADAVRWAAEKGIVTGFESGDFRPEENVTREQLAAMLYRCAQSKGQGFTGMWMFRLSFEDAAEISDWANEAVHWMVMNGVINGKTESTLEPKSFASRAEAATMIMRFALLDK